MFFSLADYGGKRCVTKMSLLDMEVIGRNGPGPHSRRRFDRNGMGSIWPTSRSCASNSSKKDVHVDDIRIVPHPHHYGREASTSTHRVTNLPFVLGEGRESWWGINPAESITSLCRPANGLGRL